LGEQKEFNLDERPGFGISVFTAMLPVLLMSIATILTLLQKTLGWESNSVLSAVQFIGNASTAMLISLLFAIYTMGLARQIPIKTVMDS
ncbi:GntT/GntP/DsdX family permease, partial [Coprococcus eutactus]|uniref:GntT/GntP/DsdX family permease n=1 Tax=Coprococcus eutactus TaxID=33043 RepID=UPI003842FD24|nr:gluconate permease [Coprococcus eutactus]